MTEEEYGHALQRLAKGENARLRRIIGTATDAQFQSGKAWGYGQKAMSAGVNHRRDRVLQHRQRGLKMKAIAECVGTTVEIVKHDLYWLREAGRL